MEIESMTSLKERRYEQVERDIREVAAKPMTFDFAISGTDIFSMMEQAQGYARRCVEFIDALKAALNADQIVAATVLGRALLETVAMGCLYVHDMQNCIESGNVKKFDERFTRYYIGVRSGSDKYKPIHVMDALRHFQKIDEEYVSYLDKKYGLFSAAMTKLNDGKPVNEQKTFIEVNSAMKAYDMLSEIAHPNGTGVQYLFPAPDAPMEDVEKLRRYYRTASRASIWQCHFLLTALKEAEGLPEGYRKAFMTI